LEKLYKSGIVPRTRAKKESCTRSGVVPQTRAKKVRVGIAVWVSNILYRQAGYSCQVVQVYYTIDRAFLYRLGPELITVYKQVSII
jgi:hypothetical protein